MTTSKVYAKDDKWFVDYLDDNLELLPTVGIFATLDQAKESARIWAEGVDKNVEIMGESSW